MKKVLTNALKFLLFFGVGFGILYYVYIQTDNTMKLRSLPSIALRPSNDNGGHYLLNLETGKRIHSYSLHELPILGSGISRVQQLAKQKSTTDIQQ